MEKTITKTIREAFKKAYINKILKESSEELSKKLNPAELKKAEEIYPKWATGRKNIVLGDESNNIINYLVEKGVEEYKQTRDEKLRQAIVSVYQPIVFSSNKETGPQGNAVFKAMMSSKISGHLRKRFGSIRLEDAQDAAGNAWAYSIGDPEVFNKIINRYTDGPTGIGAMFMTSLIYSALEIATKSATKKRGGESAPLSFDALQNNDRDSMEFLGDKGEDFGSDKVDTGSEFDLAGDIEITDIKPEEFTTLPKLFSDFVDVVNEAQKDPKNRISEELAYAIEQMFKYNKSYSEIKNSKPEYFANRDISTMISNGLKSEKFNKIAERVAEDNGFKKDWLIKLLDTGIKKGSTGNEKLLSLISKMKDKPEPKRDTDQEDGDTEENTGWSPLLEDDIQKIMNEVYKRMKNM